ncbi:hypothetical protein [Nitrososphaera sp.]|uniref:hypothetical protein n=1 Tax=Nitrososphaera sp. TaxID=1971748 RepID=UPI002ED9E0BE
MTIDNALLDVFYSQSEIDEKPESRIVMEAGRNRIREYTFVHAEANIAFVTESVFSGETLKDFIHVIIEGQDVTLLSAIMLCFIRQYRNVALLYLHKKEDDAFFYRIKAFFAPKNQGIQPNLNPEMLLGNDRELNGDFRSVIVEKNQLEALADIYFKLNNVHTE